MKLTQKRKQVIEGMIAGKTAKQIAAEMVIEEKSVKRHKEVMYDQLGLHGGNPQAKLIAWYMENYGHNI